MEQDDFSLCSSFPPLDSSNDTEIVTIGEECVPSVPEDNRNMFLIIYWSLTGWLLNVSGLVRTMGEYLNKIPNIPSIPRIMWNRIPRLNINIHIFRNIK